MAPRQPRFSPESVQALRIAAAYALIGCLWMLLSSGILALLMSRHISVRDLPWGDTMSGMLVVLATSLLLFLLVKKKLDDSRRATQALNLRDRAIESSINAIVITDHARADHPIEYVNPAFTRITGYAAAEVLGRNWTFLLGDDMDQPALESISAALRENREGRALLRNYRKDGSLFWNDLHLAPVQGDSGAVTHFIGILNDVSNAIRYQDELEHQANHDTLTGLPNRNLLKDRIAQAIAYAQRYQRSLAVAFIDLDNFKLVNDSLGHHAGDQLLRTVATRLLSCVRVSDTVARLGGDEFVVLLCDHPHESGAACEPLNVTLQRILDEVALPYQIGPHEFFLSCSIGYAQLPGDGNTADLLLKNADMAMYRAKSLGRGRFALFEPAMRQQARERLALEESLRLAGGDGQFGCFLQPIVLLEERKLVGFEALARWQHPQRGLLEPASFIDAAEDCGLIQEIDLQVMGMACAALGRWQRQPGWGGLRLSVNVSARTLGASDLVERIEPILGRSGIDPAQLYLEITETSLVEDIQSTAITIAGLQRLNLQLAIDDFGTGYSSLLYLKRFPVGLLKIDRSFVADLGPSPRDGEDEAIARAIISLAAGLGVKVVAEGVETPEQEARLLEFGCDFGQGYLYGRPMPIQEAGRQWFDE